MTLPLARDLKPLGIRVNTIAPGVFDTPMLHPEGLSAEAEAAIARRNAEFLPDLLFPGRVGKPEEFAALVEHLVTNPYLNAEVVRLDGGLRLSGR
jgi:NAD(P)-dependent dehydrogenase (short-subunit alcohol dehydrogenase family)